MTENKIIDPFFQFIRDNRCEEKCAFDSPLSHTHKLYDLHNNVTPSKTFHHQWTSVYTGFGKKLSFYMSHFACECGNFFRVITPRAGYEKEVTKDMENTSSSQIKLIYLKNET